MIKKEEEKEVIELKIIYYLNDSGKKECLINLDKDKEYITYRELTEKFIYFLKSNFEEIEENENSLTYNDFDFKTLNNITFENIRYFHSQGWISLKNNEIIDLQENNQENTINIIIKANILSKENLMIKKRYTLIKNELNNLLININSNISNKNTLENIENNNIFDIIILIANPLMDKEKELRTMNDFNIIAYSIQDIISQSIESVNFQFLPLTKINFIESISIKKPIILHIICKSIYDLEENNSNNYKNSSDITYLLFENKDFNVDKISKEDIDELFQSNELKENIKNINLIISTPLTKDTYEIFKKYEFRNILVQHTTLADVNYISKFNYSFYEYILGNNNCDIYNAYLNSLCQNDYIKDTQFCCCFHQHDINDNCEIVKNLRNELYLGNNYNVHFNHLNFYCDCNRLYSNFCNHFENCENLNNFNNKNNIKNSKNKCCCKKKTKHTLEFIFSKNFKEQKNDLIIDKNKNSNIINIGTKIRFNLNENKTNNIPDYRKMKILLGKNKIVFEAMNFLINNSKDNKVLNIYNDEIHNLLELAEIIIEYYKERYTIINFIRYYIKVLEDLECLDNDKSLQKINNFVYFIFIDDLDLVTEEKMMVFIKKNKIIFFTEKEIQIANIKVINFKVENLSCQDYYIKYQNEKINFKDEESFKNNILSKVKNKLV